MAAGVCLTSICSTNYWNRITTLLKSAMRQNPEMNFEVLLIDDPRFLGAVKNQARFRVLDINNLDLSAEEVRIRSKIYDTTEFATSLKPALLRGLLRKYEVVLYLDPDIEVFSSLKPLIDCTQLSGLSLTPHRLTSCPSDAMRPSESDLSKSGSLNLGYIGVTGLSRPFLDEWDKELSRNCLNAPELGMFTDQLWVSNNVTCFPHHVVQLRGANVAYWNFDERPITKFGNSYFVGEDELLFVHFSGYEPDNPDCTTRHHVSVRVPHWSDAVLSELFSNYDAQLRSSAVSEVESRGRSLSELFPGHPNSRAIRRYLRRHLLDNSIDADTVNCNMRTLSFLAETELSTGLPRYLLALYEDDEVLRSEFPDLETGDALGLFKWMCTYRSKYDSLVNIFLKHKQGTIL